MARWPKLKTLRLFRRKKDIETRAERVKNVADKGPDWWAVLRALAPKIGYACLIAAAFLAVLWFFFYFNGTRTQQAGRPDYQVGDECV